MEVGTLPGISRYQIAGDALNAIRAPCHVDCVLVMSMSFYGISDAAQLTEQALASQRRRPVPVAFTLLASIGDVIDQVGEDWLAAIYEQMRVVTYSKGRKITFPNRYAHIDAVTIECLKRIFPADTSLRAHDMAASNAITSLELFEKLNSEFPSASLHATDYYNTISIVSLPDTGWRVVFDAEGHLLQAVKGRRVVPFYKMRTEGPLRRMMDFPGKKVIEYMVAAKAARILSDSPDDPASVQRLELWHPKCVVAAKENPRFSLGRDDIYNPAPGGYELLRIMGTVCRLPSRTIPALFPAVLKHVVDGGIFLGADNQKEYEPLYQATFFQRRGNRFFVLEDVGAGYNYKNYVLDVRL